MTTRTRTALLLPILAALATAQEHALHYDAAQLVLAPDDPRITGVLDYDGDGDLDALGASAEVIYENDGQGVFTAAWTRPGPSGPNGPTATGDLNGDGLEDFGFLDDSELYLWLSDGELGPQALPVVTVPFVSGFGFSVDFEIADVTGDGRDDCIVLTDRGVHVVEAVLPWGSNPVASLLLPQIGTPKKDYYEVVVLHADDDGVLELVARTSDTVSFVEHDGASLVELAGGTYSTSNTKSMAAGDIDGDGDDDLALFYGINGCGFQYHLVQTTPGVFAPLAGLGQGGPATDLADVDADGDLDGLCCGGGGGPSTSSTSRFEVSLNDGNGHFDCAYRILGSGASHLAGADDLDADGDVDLIAGHAVYFSIDGNYRNPHEDTLVPMGIRVNVADFDHDGDTDVVGRSGDLLESDGTGALDDVELEVLGPSAGLHLAGGYDGDWDGDGDLDLLYDEWSGPGPRTGALYRNTGGGVFARVPGATAVDDPFDYADGTLFGSFELDVDGDGDSDLLLARSLVTQVWTNDGDGLFTQAHSFEHSLFRIEDLDGDGDADMVFGGPGLGVAWRENQGGGAWSDPVWIDPGMSFSASAHRIAVGDLDADGDMDVVGRVGSVITAQLNDGTGAFTAVPGILPPAALHSGPIYMQFAIADFDVDGVPDLLRHPAELTDDAVLLYRGLGGLAFEEVGLQVFELGLQVDVDADGDSDFVGDETYRCLGRLSPQHGMRRQFGAGRAGTGGIVPKLGGEGTFHVGQAIRFVATGIAGGAAGFRAFSTGEGHWPNFLAPGLTVYLDLFDPGFVVLPFQAGGAFGEPGAGRAEGPLFLIPPGLAGASLYAQAVFLDAGAPQGLSATGAVEVVFGEL